MGCDPGVAVPLAIGARGGRDEGFAISLAARLRRGADSVMAAMAAGFMLVSSNIVLSLLGLDVEWGKPDGDQLLGYAAAMADRLMELERRGAF